MVEDSVDYRYRPCAGCPWRTDADLPSFGVADMRKLLNADGRPGAEAPATAPVMSCHQDQPGSPRAMRLCAGWLAVVGPHHLAIRMAQIAGTLAAEATCPGPDWPPLHGSLDEMLDSWPEEPNSISTTKTRPRNRVECPSASRSPRPGQNRDPAAAGDR